MMKNVIDVLAGGISYWAIGHGLCIGKVLHHRQTPG